MIVKKQVEGAVSAVLKLLGEEGKVKLVDQPQKIDVQFTLKHVPKLSNKTIHIDLPHSIHFESREVCLFVKDMDKKNREYEMTVQHYEELLKKEKVTSISKIIPIKALRTDYSLSSSKVSLAKAYDLFVGDAPVMGLLPGILGKIFYGKKKTMPVKVNLGAKPLKNEIDRVVNNTRCVLHGTGSSSLVTVAHDRLKKSDIVSNILAACTQLADKLPGGQENIRNIYIKGSETAAVPVYVDLESANSVKLPEVKPTALTAFTDDISTVLGGKLMVRADGMVQYIRDPVVKTEKQEAGSGNEDTGSEDTSDEEDSDMSGEEGISDDEANSTGDVSQETNFSKTNKKQGKIQEKAVSREQEVTSEKTGKKKKGQQEIAVESFNKKETKSETTGKKKRDRQEIEVIEDAPKEKKSKQELKAKNKHKTVIQDGSKAKLGNWEKNSTNRQEKTHGKMHKKGTVSKEVEILGKKKRKSLK